MAVIVVGGRYVVQRLLGSGAQGEVYEALDTHEGDIVALKLLTGFTLGGPWLEAQILRRLVDPHILPIRNADQDLGRPYLVTELATHGSLDSMLAASAACGLSVDDVVRWTRHACHGIARAHDLHLLHNDIKPGNLFLNAKRECLVADFGFAALIPTGATATVPLGFTPETVAPEVAASYCLPTPTPTATLQSDIYSLGATAYWLLAARPQHDFSLATDVAAKVAIAASHTPPRLYDLAPHVPPYLSTAIEKAMAVNANARYPTATAFAAALGARPTATRSWRRTDEHASHLACWRGEPAGGGNLYILCLEPGARASMRNITTTHAASGNRVTRGCRTASTRSWAQAVRSVMRALG